MTYLLLCPRHYFIACARDLFVYIWYTYYDVYVFSASSVAKFFDSFFHVICFWFIFIFFTWFDIDSFFSRDLFASVYIWYTYYDVCIFSVRSVAEFIDSFMARMAGFIRALILWIDFFLLYLYDVQTFVLCCRDEIVICSLISLFFRPLAYWRSTQ